jgi:hypothetical protein
LPPLRLSLRIGARERLALIFDDSHYEELDNQ